MATATRPRLRYDVAKMVADMGARGWLPTDLARAAGLSDMTVHRFLKGEFQTERTNGKLAEALGYSPRRYIRGVVGAAA